MMKENIEKVRLDIALGLTYTDWVKKNGMSVVQPKRLKQTIDSVVDAYKLPSSPKPEDVYTERFLPTAAERMVK
jgi:NitT/TauT family transport system substrate-binding protein